MQPPHPQRKTWKQQVLTANGLADRRAMWRAMLRTSDWSAFIPIPFEEAVTANPPPDCLEQILKDVSRSVGPQNPTTSINPETLVGILRGYWAATKRLYMAGQPSLVVMLLQVLPPKEALLGLIVLDSDPKYSFERIDHSSEGWLPRYVDPIMQQECPKLRAAAIACGVVLYMWAYRPVHRLFTFSVQCLPACMRLWDYVLLHGNLGIASLVTAAWIRAHGDAPVMTLEAIVNRMNDYWPQVDAAEALAMIQHAEKIRKRAKRLFPKKRV